ncbi:N-acetylglutamate kinase [Marinoscillum furvescens DSM 4134]|uniref:Acetylglutamate kinase n=2 Tax=Marinoscillum furvescens TaxID=1026 RepID=A0A3D9L3W5_MARFU|nr:N-acetylglutamate kinase [Marinoscillum furvescens DSM 4134]
MVNDEIKRSVMLNICELHAAGHRVVVVHGGGPFINSILEKVQITSEFIGGHRKTTPEAMKYIEMTLLGEVNSGLVTLINHLGQRAVGLSGKDGGLARASKRFHQEEAENPVDLGQVGNIDQIDPTILFDLLDKNYIPVVACVAPDEQGNTYNINADMMAGAVAGAISADHYCVLTDVDGLMMDKDDASSLIQQLQVHELQPLFQKVIVGGMIPKIESCQIAIDNGAQSARIVNGTRLKTLTDAILEHKPIGTIISK